MNISPSIHLAFNFFEQFMFPPIQFLLSELTIVGQIKLDFTLELQTGPGKTKQNDKILKIHLIVKLGYCKSFSEKSFIIAEK